MQDTPYPTTYYIPAGVYIDLNGLYQTFGGHNITIATTTPDISVVSASYNPRLIRIGYNTPPTSVYGSVTLQIAMSGVVVSGSTVLSGGTISQILPVIGGLDFGSPSKYDAPHSANYSVYDYEKGDVIPGGAVLSAGVYVSSTEHTPLFFVEATPAMGMAAGCTTRGSEIVSGGTLYRLNASPLPGDFVVLSSGGVVANTIRRHASSAFRNDYYAGVRIGSGGVNAALVQIDSGNHKGSAYFYRTGSRDGRSATVVFSNYGLSSRYEDEYSLYNSSITQYTTSTDVGDYWTSGSNSVYVQKDSTYYSSSNIGTHTNISSGSSHGGSTIPVVQGVTSLLQVSGGTIITADVQLGDYYPYVDALCGLGCQGNRLFYSGGMPIDEGTLIFSTKIDSGTGTYHSFESHFYSTIEESSNRHNYTDTVDWVETGSFYIDDDTYKSFQFSGAVVQLSPGGVASGGKFSSLVTGGPIPVPDSLGYTSGDVYPQIEVLFDEHHSSAGDPPVWYAGLGVEYPYGRPYSLGLRVPQGVYGDVPIGSRTSIYSAGPLILSGSSVHKDFIHPEHDSTTPIYSSNGSSAYSSGGYVKPAHYSLPTSYAFYNAQPSGSMCSRRIEAPSSFVDSGFFAVTFGTPEEYAQYHWDLMGSYDYSSGIRCSYAILTGIKLEPNGSHSGNLGGDTYDAVGVYDTSDCSMYLTATVNYQSITNYRSVASVACTYYSGGAVVSSGAIFATYREARQLASSFIESYASVLINASAEVHARVSEAPLIESTWCQYQAGNSESTASSLIYNLNKRELTRTEKAASGYVSCAFNEIEWLTTIDNINITLTVDNE